MKVSSPIVMAYPGPPRRAAGLLRIILLALVLVTAFFYFHRSPQPASLGSPLHESTSPGTDVLKTQHPAGPAKPAVEPPSKEGPKDKESTKEAPAAKPAESKETAHPIDSLIATAEKTYDDLMKKETHDLKTAAKVYRERRGRHPPPGFDDWFKFAQDNGAVIVEDFFDQIYHDLNPFWGLSPATMRKEGWDHEMTINIRDRKASAGSDWFWTQIWLNLTQTIEHLLPDMDIALNAMDEPRVVAPWEKINEYMEIERKERAMPPAAEVVSVFQSLPKPAEGDRDVPTREKNWEKTRVYLTLPCWLFC